MNEQEEYLLELGFDVRVLSAPPSLKEIQSAYRELAKKYHPDTSEEPDSEEKFKRVHYAYKCLTDPSFVDKEKNYKRSSLNQNLGFFITFEEAFFGGKYLINITSDSKAFENEELMNDIFLTHKVEAKMESVVMDIAPGSFKASPTLFQEKGISMDGMRGDLIVTVNIKPHPLFRPKEGLHIASDLKIPLKVMLEGAQIDVQTMYGLKSIIVPPGTQPNSELELKKCGVSKTGSHFFLVTPIYPTQEDLRNDDWDNFKVNWGLQEELDKMDEELQKTYERLGGLGFNFTHAADHPPDSDEPFLKKFFPNS